VNLQQIADECPHLLSPAMLAIADTDGKWKRAPHLDLLNAEMMEFIFTPGYRLIVSMPSGHGKSWLGTIYATAWGLLLFPELRFGILGQSDEFAGGFGAQIKEVIERWGPRHGIVLKEDTRAKGEWKIRDHGGGVVCRGPHSGFTGRPIDRMIIDDVIKTHEQVLSPTVLDNLWEGYKSGVINRIRNHTGVAMIATRWSKRDIIGRVKEVCKQTGEVWKEIKFPALAEANDVLGRKPGEALWPEMCSKELLLAHKAFSPRWFPACWQQDPHAEEGQQFKPLRWPRYKDMGDAYVLESKGPYQKTVFLKDEFITLVSVDWAWSEKALADKSALGAFAISPLGDLLVLDVVNEHLGIDALAPRVASFCRQWRPQVIALESGHPTLAHALRRYPEVPEPRWVKPQLSKLGRAVDAIEMASGRRIHLPEVLRDWEDDYTDQLSNFTGLEKDEQDDMVDMTSQGCYIARQLRCEPRPGMNQPPELFVGGRQDF
jgi:hypothetical protein